MTEHCTPYEPEALSATVLWANRGYVMQVCINLIQIFQNTVEP